MTIHYLHTHGLNQQDEPDVCPPATRTALSKALSVRQPSPRWNNRKPDIVRVQLGARTLLAVPYRRWAWRRYELRVAESRRRQA